MNSTIWELGDSQQKFQLQVTPSNDTTSRCAVIPTSTPAEIVRVAGGVAIELKKM
jgi:hypothetical protein